MKINKILDEDERHKSSGCIKTKGRRLYIRNYTYVLDIRWESGPKKKQIFIPVGIICLNCGFMRVNLGGHMDGLKEKEIKIPDYPELPKYEDTHFSRQQKRRGDRLQKERIKRLDELGIKDRRKVITRLE